MQKELSVEAELKPSLRRHARYGAGLLLLPLALACGSGAGGSASSEMAASMPPAGSTGPALPAGPVAGAGGMPAAGEGGMGASPPVMEAPAPPPAAVEPPAVVDDMIPEAGSDPGDAGDTGEPPLADAADPDDGTDLSSGCAMAPPSGDTGVSVGGQTGSYILDLPSDYDNSRAYPLVFSWHGFGVSNTSFHGYLDLRTAIGNEAILVTPETLDGGSNWPTSMDYFDTLLEHFESSYCIDRSRVFVAGHSMGGMFTSKLGCERGDKLRGIASLAANPPRGACQGQPAVLIVHGDADSIGGGGIANRDYWADKNACDVATPADADPSPCVDYGGCDADATVRFCQFAGGHEIPRFVAGAVWTFFEGA